MLVVLIASRLLSGSLREIAFFLVIPLAMAAFGFLLLKALVGDPVDEVWDGGEHLLVKNGHDADQIPLSKSCRGRLDAARVSGTNEPALKYRK